MQASDAPAILSFSAAGYGWGAREVLSGLTLRLEPGGFYFLTGPSGAGKTTFLKLCYLDLALGHGSLEIFGRPAEAMTRDEIARTRRRIGVIHQDCQFLDHLSLRENIALPLTVSGGERQRAALARAVVAAPDLILADEPTGNVDWEMSERLLGLLIQLNRQGKTVVVATHDLPLIRSARSQVAVRVLRLSAGRLTVAGGEV